jgi:hypothetical protein
MFSVDTYPGIAGRVGFDIRYYLGKDQLATGLKLNFINSRYTERFDAFYAGELFVLFQVPMIYTRQVFKRWSVGGGISHNILMATDRRLAHWKTERQYYLGSHVELNFHISERWAVSLQHEYIGWFKVRTYREYVYGNYNLLFRYQL